MSTTLGRSGGMRSRASSPEPQAMTHSRPEAPAMRSNSVSRSPGSSSTMATEMGREKVEPRWEVCFCKLAAM